MAPYLHVTTNNVFPKTPVCLPPRYIQAFSEGVASAPVKEVTWRKPRPL